MRSIKETMTSCLYPGGEDFLGEEIRCSHFSEKKLSYSVYSGAYVLPFKHLENGKTGGGVETHEGEYLLSSGVHYGFCCSYCFDRSNVKHKNEDVIYLGMFNGAWGHCLTDNIRRIWFLKSDEYRNSYPDCKIVYTALDSFSFSDSFIKLLSIFGLEAEKLEKIDEIREYRNIIIPDESFYSDGSGFRFFTNEYLENIGQIRNYALTVKPPIDLPTDIGKIYLSYSQYSIGKTSGEEMLAEFFSQNGFTIIAPENFSFDSQLYLYSHCDIMASTVGSCSHNSIFLKDGADLILIPRAYYLTGYQAALNEVNSINITLVDSSLSDRVNSEYPWGGPFCFFVSHELERLFDEDSCTKRLYAKNMARRTLKNYFHIALQCERMFTSEEINPPEYYQIAVQGYIAEMFSTLGISQRCSNFVKKTLRFLNNIYVRIKKC